MSREIERKFLVKGAFKDLAHSETRIVQGYLSSVPERTVRVRILGDAGFLTIKGIGNESGASRFEWEQEIPVEDAQQLLEVCEPGIIDKVRYLVKYAGFVWEVDDFSGDNSELVLAEIELPDEGMHFERPSWLGEEVTGDPRYYNSMLRKNPFNSWK